MIRARRKSFLPLSVLMILAAIPASQHAQVAPKPSTVPFYGGTLRVKGYYTPFNPVFDPASASHYFITEQLYDGLVKFDSRFNPTPALAEYWTISDGGARITFRLRKGVRFHNGRPLSASDVKFSLERLIRHRGNTASQHFVDLVIGAAEFRQGTAIDVSGFRVVDDQTFEIRWVRPYVSGLYLLGMFPCKILPKDLVEGQGRNFFQKPIGTGPFRFAEWLRNSRLDILGVRLEANADYYDRQPYLSALEYSPHYTDEQFESGGVHIISVTSEKQLHGRFPILENSTLKSYFLAFSCDLPPLDRPEVRKALALALDKKRLAEASDTPSTAHQVLDKFIPPLLPGFFPKEAGSFSDPDTARLLLDRLLPDGGRKALTLTLLCDPPRTDEANGFARELGRQLAALEIKLEVKFLRRPEDAKSYNQPYLKFLVYTMDFPDPENIIGPLYRSDSAVNAANSRFSNARLDGLLHLAESEPSWERRTGLFREMEKILFDEAPALPLFSERIRIAYQPRVRGLQVPPMGFQFLEAKDVWIGGEKRP